MPHQRLPDARRHGGYACYKAEEHHPRPKRNLLWWEECRALIPSLLPTLLIGAVFVLLPITFSLCLTFWDWPLLGSQREFIGLANWTRLLHDPHFWHGLKVSMLYTMGSVPLYTALALCLALGLQNHRRGWGWLRTAYYLPIVVPVVAAGLFWRGMFQPQIGAVNVGLRALGLPAPLWLVDPQWALVALIIVSVWQHTGYYTVFFVVGLSGIPRVLGEAAQLDGANAWQRFWLITWPLLRPTLALVLIVSTVFSLQSFALPYVITNGGPMRSTTTLVLYLYERAFGFQELGYGATLGWALALITFPLTAISFWMRARRSVMA